jgi:hypothetical protein
MLSQNVRHPTEDDSGCRGTATVHQLLIKAVCKVISYLAVEFRLLHDTLLCEELQRRARASSTEVHPQRDPSATSQLLPQFMRVSTLTLNSRFIAAGKDCDESALLLRGFRFDCGHGPTLQCTARCLIMLGYSVSVMDCLSLVGFGNLLSGHGSPQPMEVKAGLCLLPLEAADSKALQRLNLRI